MACISYGQELNYKSYTISDGLPDMQVNGINVDRKGNLWVSTRGGISKFDGEHFQNFDHIECLPKYAFCSAEDKDGNIWISSSEALIKFDGVDCVTYPYPEWTRGSYRQEFTFINDDLLLGSSPYQDAETFFFKNGKFINFKDSFNLKHSFRHLVYDSTRNVFIGTVADSVLIFNNAQILRYYPAIESSYSKNFTLGILGHMSRPNHIYSINSPDGITTSCFTIDDSLNMIPRCQHSSQTKDSDHTHSYIDNKNDRLSLFSRKSKKHYVLTDVKSKFNLIWDIKEIGDYFYFVSDKGLIKWYPERFFSYPEKDLPYVWLVAETPDNDIYIGSYGKGIKKINDNKIQQIETIYRQCDDPLHSGSRFTDYHKKQLDQIYFHACHDEIGNTYIPHSVGISKLKKDHAELFYNHCTRGHGKSPATLYTYYDEVNKHIVSCHCKHIMFLDLDGNIKDELSQDSLLNNSCVLTAVRHQDAMYFGYRPHVAKYTQGKLTLLSYPSSKVDETYICSMVDHEDKLWFGGKSGLYQIENDSITKFPFLDGESIQSILQYSPTKMFITTVDGLYMFNLEKFYKTGSYQYRLYNHTNGYPGIEPNQNGLYIDSKDRLWITSSTVLSYTDISSLDYITIDYNLQIATINNKNTLLNTDTFAIAENINSADIQFSLIGFDRPSEYLTSYAINNKDFTIPSKNRYAHLEDLSSGIHQLNAKIFDVDNNLITEENFYLDVNIPFYAEPWWSSLLFIAVIGLFFWSLFFWYRSRSKEKERKLLVTQNTLIQQSADQLENLNLQLESENKILQKRIQRSLNIVKPPNEPIPLGPKNEFLVKPQSIIYAKSERNRLTIQLEDKPIFVYSTLREFKSLLPETQFAQINRSTIINVQKIKFKDIDRINMSNDEILKMSKSGRAELEEVLSVF